MKSHTKAVRTPRHKHRRALIAIGIVFIGTIALSTFTYMKLNEESDERFITDTRTITQFIIKNVDSYKSILYGARSYVSSAETLHQQSWDNFIRSQQAFTENPGLSSVYLVSIVNHDDVPLFIEGLQAESLVGQNFSIQPTGDRPSYAIVKFITTDHELDKFRGFDLTSTDYREEVYANAAKQNQPLASKPITLASGKKGFFIILPIFAKDKTVTEYIGATFRTQDFVASLYSNTDSPVATQVTDITSTHNPIVLFATKNWLSSSPDLTRQDIISFGGRTWQIQYRSERSYDASRFNFFLPSTILLLGGVIILLILLAHVRHLRLIETKL